MRWHSKSKMYGSDRSELQAGVQQTLLRQTADGGSDGVLVPIETAIVERAVMLACDIQELTDLFETTHWEPAAELLCTFTVHLSRV